MPLYLIDCIFQCLDMLKEYITFGYANHKNYEFELFKIKSYSKYSKNKLLQSQLSLSGE